MKDEPHFLIESLSRWDFRWRLSQTGGPQMLPAPLDFHTTVEAIHHMKRISFPFSCSLVLYLGPSERVEIRTPAMAPAGEVTA